MFEVFKWTARRYAESTELDRPDDIMFEKFEKSCLVKTVGW